MNIEWTVINPGNAINDTFQQIGGFIGTGDQSNYLKFVATENPAGDFELILENDDNIVSQTYIQASNLFDAPDASSIVFNLAINVNTGFATPTATYVLANGGTTTVSGAAINLNGTAVFSAINGNFTINGQTSGLAVGLYSTNFDSPVENTFSAIFDNVEISAT